MLKINFLKALIVDTLFFNKISASFLKRLMHKCRGATVFVHHLVCDNPYHTFLKLHHLSQMDVDLFKKQLTWLLNNGFSFTTIDDLSTMITNGEDISAKLIAITFDDGYKITIENVLPVLEVLKIKATFFITTDWINSKVLLWQHKYFWYLKNYGLKDFFDNIKQIDKEYFTGLDYRQCHIKFMKYILPKQKETLLQLYGRPIPYEENIASNIYPSTKDVLRLNSSGMQIGSHSCGHYFMQNLPDDLYFEEMLKSKKKLESLIKKPVETFSYPFNSYREDSELVKNIGYKTLCTVDKRKVTQFSSLLKLPRFNAPVRNILFENSLRKILYFKK